MNVALENAEIVGSVLSGAGGSTGGWRCSKSAPSIPQLSPATPKNPPPFTASLLLFCFHGDGRNQYSTRTAGGDPFLSEKRVGKTYFGMILLSTVSEIWRFCIASHSLLPISMQTKQDPGEPVLLMALIIMLHAKLCLSMVMFLFVCVLAIRKDMQGTVLLRAEGAN